MNEHGHGNEKTTIHIDRKKFDVEAEALTGAELRKLPETDISEEYDVFLEVPGGEDEPIADTKSVTLENGMHFFSAKRNINPGR